jgi:putative membrane protein
MEFAGLLVALHVSANVVWIGSILAVARVLSQSEGDSKLRGRIALDVYRKLATPAFGLSFLAGVARLTMSTHYYFVQTKFMHGKLTFALAVIALHHIIGARARKMADGSAPDAGPVKGLALGLVLSAVAAVFFAVLKPF